MEHQRQLLGSRLKQFFHFLFFIFQDTVKNRRLLFSKIIFLDAINASSKIAVVLIIALSVKALGDPNGIEVYSLRIENSRESIWVIGFIIGLIALIGAISAFAAINCSRQLGRWANEKAMTDIYQVLASEPRQAAVAKLKVPSNLNILMTQFPLHTGLAYETASKLANPILVALFACAALLYQHALFALIIFLLSFITLPILLSTSLKVQQNAKSFYGEKSQQMGANVAAVTTVLNYQHGIASKANEQLNSLDIFLDSFDNNILANNRTALIVALLEAFLRPALFIVICSLVFLQEFSAEAAIAFLGSLAYLLASSKTILSLLTNLLRFQPQFQKHQNLVNSFIISGNETIKKQENHVPNSQKKESQTPTILLLTQPLSTVNLGHFLPAIVDHENISSDTKPNNIYFVFAAFRYKHGLTIEEQLCGGETTKENRLSAVKMCEKMGATNNILELENGFSTVLSEQTWTKLSANSRAAIRLIPLALKPNTSIILIDFQILKSLSQNDIENAISMFSHCRLIITTPNDIENRIPGANFAVINDFNQIELGDTRWFEHQVKAQHNAYSQGSNISTNIDPTIF